MRSFTRITLATFTAITTAVAQQGDRKGHVMDDPIPTEKIPPSPYLNLKDAVKTFQLPSGYTIEPVAAGKQVNMVVALAFDANGRAWTVEMRNYMIDLDGNDENAPTGQIRILEDTDGDGKIDKTTTFLDGLIVPRAVAVTSDGCLYTNGSGLYFIERDGLKPKGKPILIDKDYAVGGNPEHRANGLIYGHDNWYYSAKSDRRYRRINGSWVKQSTDFRGQWGIAKDNLGRLYFNTNSTMLIGDWYIPDFFRGSTNYTPRKVPTQRLGSNAVHPIRITPGVNRAYLKNTLDKDGKLANTTAACGVHIYRGQNFPADMQGMAFVCEPAGELIKAIKIERDNQNKPSGSHPYKDKEFLATTDEWFLPCNIYTAPDGTMWIIDMYFGLLQHKAYMTSYLRKQYTMRKLDKPKPSTGRIYRIRYQRGKVGKVPQLEGKKPSELVAYLAHPNGTVRDTAQRLIVESGDTSVTLEVAKMVVNPSKPFGQIHAMWTLEGLGTFHEKAFTMVLKSTNRDIVRTALNVLSNIRPSTPNIQMALKSATRHPSTDAALARATAANGLTDEALRFVLKNNNITHIREAFVSGLGNNAHEFKKQHPDLSDNTLKKLLDNATKTSPQKTIPDGAHLKGSAFATFKRGKEIYTNKGACFGCHGGKGEGMPNLAPPLAPSEWVTENPERLAKILLHGMAGPITVNGKKYNLPAAMPKVNLNDAEIADVMTYIRNAWGNQASVVDQSLVKKTRAANKGRVEPFTEKELK